MPRFPLDTDDDPVRTPAQTESAKERGFKDEDAPYDFGETNDIEESEGDIADEGAGHRD
jgi:hypothetical protein